jgi:lactobin A/cerein 7B family class IIb bacteriocin
MAAQVVTRHDLVAKPELSEADLEKVAGGGSPFIVIGSIALVASLGGAVSVPVTQEEAGW